MKSNLQHKHNKLNNPLSRTKPLLFSKLDSNFGKITKCKQNQILAVYCFIYTLSLSIYLVSNSSVINAFAMGLVLPGAGFLYGVKTISLTMSLLFFLATMVFFCLAILIWFATGNVLAAPLVWSTTLLGATFWKSYHPDSVSVLRADYITLIVYSIGPALVLLLIGFRYFGLFLGQTRRMKLNQYLGSNESHNYQSRMLVESSKNNELTLTQLQHMRLLLDRALQPIDSYQGYEWLDQFQTAAVRYQINFISYALSMAQSIYLPAFTGYLDKAQDNLLKKQEDYRIWRYWAMENMWGNLQLSSDPVKRDNIMYSGFVAAQLSYARKAGYVHDATKLKGLNCKSPNNRNFNYSYSEIIKILVKQYLNAEYGLLACEPNWIYPLCNAISATAIRTHDSIYGTTYWDEIQVSFRHALETEFIIPAGQFVPFRSSYTGFAAPQIGGAVMQAFPCFFLNAVLPDIAERQWLCLTRDMTDKSWRRSLWPVDIGNYTFSRASSYAATAAAARELGDDETANLLLQYLNVECPKILIDNVAHYQNASLWANATAFMAQTGTANSLRNIVTEPYESESNQPYLAEADYSDVIVAKTIQEDQSLTIVAYPANKPGQFKLQVGGLRPNTWYQLKPEGRDGNTFHTNAHGMENLSILLDGRTTIQIYPIS